jgi:hypothetical protein
MPGTVGEQSNARTKGDRHVGTFQSYDLLISLSPRDEKAGPDKGPLCAPFNSLMRTCRASQDYYIYPQPSAIDSLDDKDVLRGLKDELTRVLALTAVRELQLAGKTDTRDLDALGERMAKSVRDCIVDVGKK